MKEETVSLKNLFIMVILATVVGSIVFFSWPKSENPSSLPAEVSLPKVKFSDLYEKSAQGDHTIYSGIPFDKLVNAVQAKENELIDAGNYKTKLSKREVYIELEDGNFIRQTLDNVNDLGEPGKISREKIYWEEVLPDVDIMVATYDSLVKEDLYVKSQEGLDSLSWQIEKSDELEMSFRDNSIFFSKKENAEKEGEKQSKIEVIRLLPPIVKDESNRKYEFSWELKGESLFLSTEEKDLQFPLIVDPSYTVVAGGETGSLAWNNSRKLARSSTGDLYAVYTRTDSVLNIFFASSTDSGQTWVETQITANASVGQDGPVIAVDSNDYIHIVWYGGAGPTYTDIQHIVHTTSWQSAEVASGGTYSRTWPTLVIDSQDNLHVFYMKRCGVWVLPQQVWYIKYTGSWSSEIIVLAGCAPLSQYYPSAVVDNNDQIHVFWYGGYTGHVNLEIRHGWSDTGSSFTTENVTSESYYQYYPSAVVDNLNNLHLVWYGSHAGSTSYTQIRYLKYTDATKAWDGSVTNITSESYDQTYPSIAADASANLNVVWVGKSADSTTYEQVRHAQYTGSWSSATDLTSSNTHKYYPSLIFASFPIIDFLHTNRPKTGYAFVYNDDTTIKYFESADLTWDVLDYQHQFQGTIKLQGAIKFK